MSGKKSVASEHTRNKIFITKWFSVCIGAVFAAMSRFPLYFAVDEQVNTICTHLFVICLLQAGFNAWCDTDDDVTMTARQGYGEYLVAFCNLYIMGLCRESENVFVKGVIILVMPVYFTREAQSSETQALFGVVHFAAIVARSGGDVTGETAQWLVNLLIVNFIVVDMAMARQAAARTRHSLADTLSLNQSLLLTSYDATFWGSFKNKEPGVPEAMIAYGTPQLSQLFGWQKPMDRVALDSKIITSGLDELRDFFVEATQNWSLPEYRRRVMTSCRDARGMTFEAEFRVAPRMRGDVRGEDVFFLGIRVIGEKRQALNEPILECEECPSDDKASGGSQADTQADAELQQAAPPVGTPLWSWFRGPAAQKVLITEAWDVFDCRDACWQVLIKVPGLLAVRCNTKSRFEVIDSTPDALRLFPGILQRPVYDLTTQELSMFMRRKLMNVQYVMEFSGGRRLATHCEDVGVFKLRGGHGQARIVAALVTTRAVPPTEQAQPEFLIIIARLDATSPEESRVQEQAGMIGLHHPVAWIEDDIGSATSAAGLHMRSLGF